jgi:hypothetical protein
LNTVTRPTAAAPVPGVALDLITLAGPAATPPISTSVQAPSQSTLTIDLEDPSMRDGVVPKPWLTGKPGSYFSAPEVIIAAKDHGVPVRTVDLNAGRGDKNLHAYVSLGNDAPGGAKYALITAGANPPFKVPANAGVAFIKAYTGMQDRIGKQQLFAAVGEVASAVVGLPRRGQSVRPTPAANRRPLVATGPTGAARTQAPGFRRVSYRGVTDLGFLMDGIGRMLPGLHVNPKGGLTNCLSAAVALERQRAGKPALALKQHVPYEHDVYNFYGRLPIAVVPKRSGPPEPFDMASMLKHVESLPRGARGLLLVSATGNEYGHVMVIENVNGRAVIMDGQNGYVVNPKALSTGVTLGERMPMGGSLARMPDRTTMKYEFLRTDDVRTPGSALPKNVRQARVEVVDRYSNTVCLQVMDRQGEVTRQWIDQSKTPGVLKNLLAGENVYLVNDQSSSVRAPGLLVIKQSDGLKMLKRIESRQ